MKIGCVLVLYNPDKKIFIKTLYSIVSQVEKVFIADNSFLPNEWLNNYDNKIVYQKMSGNIGIAAAQNVGIKYFTEHSFSHILFLDQDSIADKELVSQLVKDLDFLNQKLILVGAIGPRPINRESNKEYRGSVRKGKTITPYITEVTEIISSASLVPIENFEKVGFMAEDLFIDAVDHEWCWRAKKKCNYRFFISENTLLVHQIGEGDKSFFGIKILTPTPFRIYYLYRNYFKLIRRTYVPLYWKISVALKLLFKALYFPIFSKPRSLYLKNILLGIFMGIRNK